MKSNQAVEVKVAHRMEEDYQPPPKKPTPSFSGTGNRLGSTVPSMPGGFPSVIPSPESKKAQSVEVDNNQPVTSMQIRLGDGTRMVTRFNHSHTVGDLRNVVRL